MKYYYKIESVEHQKEIQRILFKEGYKWCDGTYACYTDLANFIIQDTSDMMLSTADTLDYCERMNYTEAFLKSENKQMSFEFN